LPPLIGLLLLLLELVSTELLIMPKRERERERGREKKRESARERQGEKVIGLIRLTSTNPWVRIRVTVSIGLLLSLS
jgi:hypothetical protein